MYPSMIYNMITITKYVNGPEAVRPSSPVESPVESLVSEIHDNIDRQLETIDELRRKATLILGSPSPEDPVEDTCKTMGPDTPLLTDLDRINDRVINNTNALEEIISRMVV